jgi:hypothetical protein
MQCDTCGAHYSCEVEALAQADNTFLPLSESELKEYALSNLDIALQQQATNIPCPQCGAFPASHVERVRRNTGRFIVWGLFLVLLVTLVSLLVNLAPKAPSWTLALVLIAAIVSSRLLSGPLVNKFDPNRNLELNLKYVQAKIDRGVVRTEPQREKAL